MEKYNTSLKKAILQVMIDWDKRDRGYWFGYDCMQDDLFVDFKIEAYIPQIKEVLKELHNEGEVYVEGIMNKSNGLFNGSGYFYNFEKDEKL